MATLVIGCTYNPDRTGLPSDDGGGTLPDGRVISDSTSDAPLPIGLVAWYKMDVVGPVGAQAIDSTGHGHTGTCTSCPPTAAGRIGDGFAFRTGERVDVPNDPALVMPNGFTVAAWVSFDTIPASGAAEFVCPFSKQFGTTNRNTWQLCIRGSPTTRWAFLTEQASGFTFLESDLSLPTALTFVHVAITWDSSTKQIWVGGAPVASEPVALVQFDNHAITFGADIDSGMQTSPFSGVIDDVQIYNRALAAPEIATLATP